jgi:hypothetical protein
MALQPDELADAIEQAFKIVWGQLKPDDRFPSDGRPERRVLFLAVARGLLTYLEHHQTDMISSIDLDLGGPVSSTFPVTNVELNTDLS